MGNKNKMKEQRDRARKSGKFITDNDSIDWIVISDEKSSLFLGYEKFDSESRILKYRKKDNYFEYILDKTPFYAESGGQIGDTGELRSNNYQLKIIDTIKVNDDIIHVSKDFDKNLLTDNKVKSIIAIDRRNKIKVNHTATHLLHSALKNILGDHVQQAGSLVADDRLRFDLTHYDKISDSELVEIENMVNQKIRENLSLNIFSQDFEEAKKDGAVAMFNEKYGDEVRVINVPGFSKELCGGTHVSNTTEISLFKIINESALSAGIRRIEAITGELAFNYLLESDKIVSNIKEDISCTNNEIIDRLQNIQDESKLRVKEIERLNIENQRYKIKDLILESKSYNEIKIIISRQDNIFNIKDFGDRIKEQVNDKFIAIIGSVFNDKPTIMCVVSKDLEDLSPANIIISKLAPIIDGGGGGKKSIATAGGKNIKKLDKALGESFEIVKGILDE